MEDNDNNKDNNNDKAVERYLSSGKAIKGIGINDDDNNKMDNDNNNDNNNDDKL